MSRHADPQLERRILDEACRLWARGGPEALTMRAVAKAAGTTTPTVYERYPHREDILRGLRLRLRQELLSALSRSRTLRQTCRRYLKFALEHQHAYPVLFDAVGQPPSLHEPWPSFNLFRQRLARRLGGRPQEHTRLMLALWSLMHGTAMLIIRGRFDGALRTQTIEASVDAFDDIIGSTARAKRSARSGHKWPADLVLGEAESSRVNRAGREGGKAKRASPKRSSSKAEAQSGRRR